MTYGNRYVPMTYFDNLAEARKTLRENSLLSLEMQLEYVEWLKGSRAQRAFYDWAGIYVGSRGNHGVTDGDNLPVHDQQRRAAWLHAELTDLMGKASTYYVSPDMCEMVRFAADDMRRFADEGLNPRDIPTPTGFLFFSKPLQIDVPVTDETGNEHAIERHNFIGIAWGVSMVGMSAEGVYDKDEDDVPVKPGVSYFLFEHRHDVAAMFNNNLPEDKRVAETELGFGPMHLYDYSGWAYGMPWVKTEDWTVELQFDSEGRAMVAEGVDEVRRILLATWRLLREKVVRVETNRPPRHIRRRAERFAPETGDIVIIKLREERLDKTGAQQAPLIEGHEEGDDEPWYTHRFLVRPHWHRYWVGKRDDPDRAQVLKWIEPYVKGPVGAPLIVKDRIYSLEA